MVCNCFRVITLTLVSLSYSQRRVCSALGLLDFGTLYLYCLYTGIDTEIILKMNEKEISMYRVTFLVNASHCNCI